jgi:hypothetical protein
MTEFFIDGGDSVGRWGGLDAWPKSLRAAYDERVRLMYSDARDWLIGCDDSLDNTGWEFSDDPCSDDICVWNDALGVAVQGFGTRGSMYGEVVSDSVGDHYLSGRWVVR